MGSDVFFKRIVETPFFILFEPQLGGGEMRIQCTKKLLEALQKNPEPKGEMNPVFCWHANLITLERRKAVVLVHDPTRFVVILWGLRKKDFARIGELIPKAIEQTLWMAGLSDEAIALYMEQAGTCTFTSTGDKASVARMNSSIRYLQCLRGYLDRDLLAQLVFSNKVNGDSAQGSIPKEAVAKELARLLERPVHNQKAYVVSVALDLEEHSAIRKLIIPAFFDFQEFHEVLVRAFCWLDYHLHEFVVLGSEELGGSFLPSVDHPVFNPTDLKPQAVLTPPEEHAEEDFRYDLPYKLAKTVFLDQVMPASLVYFYDFGDGWRHFISCEEILYDYDKNYASCVGGEGATPPEDVGGISGYEDFLEIVKNPEHEEYQDMRSWSEKLGYEEFDVHRINERLRNSIHHYFFHISLKSKHK